MELDYFLEAARGLGLQRGEAAAKGARASRPMPLRFAVVPLQLGAWGGNIQQFQG